MKLEFEFVVFKPTPYAEGPGKFKTVNDSVATAMFKKIWIKANFIECHSIIVDIGIHFCFHHVTLWFSVTPARTNKFWFWFWLRKSWQTWAMWHSALPCWKTWSKFHCCRKGRTIRSIISSLYFMTFNVP